MRKDNISKLGLPLLEILSSQKEQTHGNFKEINIKVISEVTFEPLDKIITFFLADYGLLPVFDVGNYDQLNYEIFNFKESKSDSAELIYIHNSTLKLFSKASGLQRKSTTEVFQSLIEDYLKSLHDFANSVEKSILILNLFELPPYRIRGSHSTRSGIIKTIGWANTQILSLCAENKNLVIHDINYISASIGLTNWYDFGSWVAFKQPFSGLALKNFGLSISSVIASYLGKSKKILITDFDNTLWGGVVGDVGAEGLKIGSNSPKGEIFSHVQSYLYDLMDSGIILAASSKNEESNVKPAFEQLSSHLQIDDFASAKINWSPKSSNIAEILNDLNIGKDSAVFIDDNPAEILEVSSSLPECSCISYEAIAIEMLQSIDASGFFEMQSISSDDLTRNQSYRENANRNETLKMFVDHDEFLASLEMEASFFWRTLNDSERLVSLNNKTNQFNTNQVMLSEASLERYSESPDKFSLSVSLTDKFGSLGTICLMIGELENEECIIRNWVMSCRVFKRGIENEILAKLIDKVRELNINFVRASINMSKKNMYCRSVYKDFGFEEAKLTPVISEYFLDISKHLANTENKNGSKIITTLS